MTTAQLFGAILFGAEVFGLGIEGAPPPAIEEIQLFGTYRMLTEIRGTPMIIREVVGTTRIRHT